ncbi:hypothetical protein SAMN05192574_101716 [Mucilaginibacter gossypiicola]|uniref:Uncharacterized protein n=1 Tax=Mucilaginibacter gossypiicola TaxID=551995 RepID=A0A1H8AYZ3_9SPHI|nr:MULTISPECIES: hypothetical protein [Mucilaginibacter]UOE52201.1 hypothetical protein MTO98_14040 [Mucilaginibacter sp. SMC90]SEM75753.1 hypothetical protein SAMN05192574_101716 [Mucilaginibacter gossypiicola]
MHEIKSLADQLRNRINKPDAPAVEKSPPQKKKGKKQQVAAPVLELLRAYDLADHKSMIHVRFETPTAQLLHHLKMASGIEVNKVVGYAVKQFLEQHPELKIIVKQYLQTIEL